MKLLNHSSSLSFTNNKFSRFFLMLVLALSLTQTASASTTKIVGHWIGSGININLKSNHTFTYKMLKVISVGGNWSTNKNTLTLNYKSLGKKKKKVATYHFKGKNLVLRMQGKKAVTLKKQ